MSTEKGYVTQFYLIFFKKSTHIVLSTSIYFLYNHYSSASGCPIANRNKMRVLENGGTIEQHKAAVAAATAMKFDGVNCPSVGCDGIEWIEIYLLL